MMRWYAVDARDQYAQQLAVDARRNCLNMTPSGRFQYVQANSHKEAIEIARKKYLEHHGIQERAKE